MVVDEPIRADVTLCAVFDEVAAEAKFLISHPRTGKLMPVEKVVFEGGEEVDFTSKDSLVDITTLKDVARAYYQPK